MLPELCSVIYSWLIAGATQKDIEKIDQQLYEPVADDVREGAPGWSDDETFDSFVAASAALQNSSSRLGNAS